MNITILSIGTRGDVQPLVALGAGLQQSGYDVRLSTHRIFENLVRERGLGFSPIAGDPRSLVIDWLRTHKSMSEARGRTFFRELVRASMPQFEQSIADAFDACHAAGAIIASPLAIAVGFHVAEKLKIPLIRSAFIPMVPTSRYPAFPLPHLLSHGPINLWTYHLLRQAFWLMIRTPTNHARVSLLDLPPLHWADPFALLDRRHQLMLIACSPSIVQVPSERGDWICQTGYWFLDHASNWEPDQELVDFIHAGPPPVYVGFGSMPSADPRQTTQLVTQALRQAGQRGVLGVGWQGLSDSTNSDDVFAVDDVPHDWLFPRMAVVVHHGGVGTTTAALRAGIPSVIVPVAADQPFWGRKLFDLGVSPRPIFRDDMTVERLAEAIHIAATDAVMRRRAARFGERVDHEDGVDRAVQAVDQWLQTRASATTWMPSPAA